MTRKLGLALLASFLALVVVGAGFGRVSTTEAAQTSGPAITGGPVAAFPGADYLTLFNQECIAGNRVRIDVRWQSYGYGPQWVDLSLHNNGWIWGTFIGVGPHDSRSNNMIWDGLLPGQWHYLRVNTLTSVGWIQSQTIAFFTRNDCQQTLVDSDRDGLPDIQDRCPFQAGPSWNGGCPVIIQPPPPPPTPSPVCNPFGGTTVAPSVIIQIGGCVTINKGDNSTYALGELVTYCYAVTQPMFVRITAQRPDGSVYTVVEGFDDGRGGCLPPVPTGLPLGTRIVQMTGGPANQLLDQTQFTVQ